MTRELVHLALARSLFRVAAALSLMHLEAWASRVYWMGRAAHVHAAGLASLRRMRTLIDPKIRVTAPKMRGSI